MLGLHRRKPAPPATRNFVTSFIDPLIAFVSAHAWLAYLTLFLAALLEAVPVVGSVIPGSTIILALSALVPGGELRLSWVLAGGDRRRGARRRLGVLDRASLRSAKSSAPGRCRAIRAWSRRARRSFIAGARWRYSSRASCRRSAPSCRSRPARSACRRCASTRSTFRRSCSGRRRMSCPACWRCRCCDRVRRTSPDSDGSAKHYWMPLVLGGALIVALAVWTIRRRHGGNADRAGRIGNGLRRDRDAR